jgi:hypothetical protein
LHAQFVHARFALPVDVRALRVDQRERAVEVQAAPRRQRRYRDVGAIERLERKDA